MKPLLGFGKHIRTNMDPAAGLVSRVFQTGMTNAPQPLGLPCAISTLQCGAAPLLSRWLPCRPHRGAGQETASLEGAKGTDFFPEASCGLSICFQFLGASPRSQFFSPAIAVLSCGSGSTQFAEFLLHPRHVPPQPPAPLTYRRSQHYLDNVLSSEDWVPDPQGPSSQLRDASTSRAVPPSLRSVCQLRASRVSFCFHHSDHFLILPALEWRLLPAVAPFVIP